jgi:hypothetical protein
MEMVYFLDFNFHTCPRREKGEAGGMLISILKKPMNTPLTEGIPWGKSLHQPTEDFCIRFL